MADPKYTAQSEVEQVFDVFDTFGKDAQSIQSSSKKDTEGVSHSVLTMSSLGQLGRFGNQLFQYAFLRICANKTGASVECPPWIGQTLFGHNDPPISHRLKPAIEIKDGEKILFDVIPEFIPYLEKLAGATSHRIGSDILEQGIADVDLWGFFQISTHLLYPYQDYVRSLFQPVSDLKLSLEQGLETLRTKGKTIVGVHIRRGDYVTQVRSGFTLVFPERWYCEWLDTIWQDLEDPVLFLCSDDLEKILPAFEKFSPITPQALKIKLPGQMKAANIDFYIDFFLLSQADVVVTSNSIFSFAACLLNERAQRFVRPCWDFSSRFVEFDPWDGEPLLWIGGQNPRFFKRFSEVVLTTYATQGFWPLLYCICFSIPKSYLKEYSIRLYLGYKIQGFIGVMKSAMSILGFRVWKRAGSQD
jgi:Glycosyl transferase family 11